MKNLLPLEAELSSFFLNNLPAFPIPTRDFLVGLLPYVASGFALFFLVYVAVSSGLLTGFIAFSSMRSLLWHTAGVTASALALMAFSPLRNRLRQGWVLLYYAQLGVVMLMLLSLNLTGLIIAGFAGFWVLFQVRERYI